MAYTLDQLLDRISNYFESGSTEQKSWVTRTLVASLTDLLSNIAAAEGHPGTVELATDAEAVAGADAARAVTPHGMAAALASSVPAASTTVAGKVELATNAEAIAGTDTARAVTPAGLAAAIEGQDAPGAAERAYLHKYSVIPEAADDDAVLDEQDLSALTQTIPSTASADVPRILTVVASVAGVAGNVVATGLDADGNEVTDTLALAGDTPVEGTVAFASLTELELPIQTTLPVRQVETAVIDAGSAITTSGNGVGTLTAAGLAGSPLAVPFAVSQGVLQEETVSVVGDITTAGDAQVNVTADGMTNSPKDVAVAVSAGTAQVETATVVAAADITTAGLAEVTITAAGMEDSPITIEEYVDLGDTAAEVAAAFRYRLGADARIAALFTVGGAGATISLTALAAAANDATLNIAIANGDCEGLTDAPTSANTTPGAVPDNAAAVAGKARTALGLDADVSAFFDITGSGSEIVLTAKAEAADDATMSVVVDNDSCAGLTQATSTTTQAGVAPDGPSEIAAALRAALDALEDVTDLFTISGAGANVILTRVLPVANDVTLNLAVDNDTCVGIVADATSNNTAAGVVPDNVSVGWGNTFGLPEALRLASLMLLKLFNGAADNGTLAVHATDVSLNTFNLAGTPDGAKALEFFYIKES